MILKKYLFFGLVFLMATYGHAQYRIASTEKPKEISLQECIDYALQNNIQLKQTALSVQNGEVQLNQSRSDLLPTVNGQFALNSNFGRNIDPFSNQIVTQTIGTNRMGVGSSLPIYNGFRLKNTIARNEINLEAAQTDVLAQKNNIALQVAVAYLNVLSSQDQIVVSEKNIEVTKYQIDRTQKMVNAGALPETNLFDLNAQLANDELQNINAINTLESALLSLKQVMNIPADTALMPSRINIGSVSLSPYPATANEVYLAAINYLPEVKAAALREQIAQKNIEIANSVGLPSVSLNANWGTAYSTAAKNRIAGETTYSPIPVTATFEGQTIPFVINFPNQSFDAVNIPYFSQFGNNQNVNIGVSANIPIFNAYAKKYQTQAAQIQKIQSELSTDNTRLQIRQNIDQAYINMLNAQKTYTASLTQVEALQRSFEAADARYNAGSGTFVDYNLARTNLDRATASQIRAKYDYLFRVKILDFYQNKPLTF